MTVRRRPTATSSRRAAARGEVAVNPTIEGIYDARQVEDGSGRRHDLFPASISQAQGEALYALTRRIGARRTLEIGMAWGLSTLFICQALRDGDGGRHTAIDSGQSEAFHGVGVLNLERAGLRDLVDVIEAPSEVVLPSLLAEPERFDLAFIDGRHVFDHALVDAFYCDRLLRPGGRLVLDDLWMPAIRRLVSYLLADRGYTLDAGDGGGGSLPGSTRRKWLIRAVRHGLRHPSEFGLGMRFGWRSNSVALVKTADDERPWNHYRAF
jgi:predicted O-methyltransferase YrrM